FSVGAVLLTSILGTGAAALGWLVWVRREQSAVDLAARTAAAAPLAGAGALLAPARARVASAFLSRVAALPGLLEAAVLDPTTAGTSGEFPTVLLTALIWCTASTVLIVRALPERTDEQRSRVRLVALAGAVIPLILATFGLNYQVGQDFIGGTTSFEEQHGWLTSLPVQSSYHLGVDGISLPLLLLSTLLFVIAMLASWRVGTRVR